MCIVLILLLRNKYVILANKVLKNSLPQKLRSYPLNGAIASIPFLERRFLKLWGYTHPYLYVYHINSQKYLFHPYSFGSYEEAISLSIVSFSLEICVKLLLHQVILHKKHLYITNQEGPAEVIQLT